MSRFAMQVNGIWIEEIESMEVCKHKINDVCCNEDCEYLGSYIYCDSTKHCEYFEKGDGIINKEE